MNNYFSKIGSISAASLRQLILLVMLSYATTASAQGLLSSSQRNVLSAAQTGTIQAMHQGDGYLTISGRDYGFHNDISLVLYEGEEVGDNFLNEGLVVRFMLNSDGILARIEVLGPLDLIEALEES